MIFSPCFLASSSWNSSLQLQQATSNVNITPAASAPVAGEGHLLQHGSVTPAEALLQGEGGGSRDGSSALAARGKPRPMSERARLLRILTPESGLKCPRCDSTRTKFCYFNNYSSAQPRHLCRNCHRYWTHGGVLRDIPVGAAYRRRRAKGSNKCKAAAASRASATAVSASGAPAITSSSSSTSCITDVAPILQTMVSSSGASSPVLPQFYGATKLLVDSAGGRAVSEMELQWGTPSPRFPALSHPIDDHQQGPAIAAPVTMATVPTTFHPGLESGRDVGVYSGDQEFPIRAMYMQL
ncbi:hypothetical protein BS78_05G017400 [Paspalum vaginatum]|nr:hypothetical protein BS78_05G017400 [Paspalum vaginatum]